MNELKTIKQQNLRYDDDNHIRFIKSYINNLLMDEEIYWKQKSKANQLRQCDKNTKIFHAKDSSRKRKNKSLDEEGKLTKEEYDVERMFYNYFTNLFSTTSPSNIKWNVKMTEEMNDDLNKLH